MALWKGPFKTRVESRGSPFASVFKSLHNAVHGRACAARRMHVLATCRKILLNSAGNAANTVFRPHKRNSYVQIKCGLPRGSSPHVYRRIMQPFDWQLKC
jgi:hypothetical protein